MENATNPPGLLGYLLASMGLTILIVWPEDGPGSWIREKILRRLIPRRFTGVLDCYVCTGFWAGLFLSIVWCWLYDEAWLWSGCLMVPALFWIFLRIGSSRP